MSELTVQDVPIRLRHLPKLPKLPPARTYATMHAKAIERGYKAREQKQSVIVVVLLHIDNVTLNSRFIMTHLQCILVKGKLYKCQNFNFEAHIHSI